jgi:hypothetical protein
MGGADSYSCLHDGNKSFSAARLFGQTFSKPEEDAAVGSESFQIGMARRSLAAEAVFPEGRKENSPGRSEAPSWDSIPTRFSRPVAGAAKTLITVRRVYAITRLTVSDWRLSTLTINVVWCAQV